jgi:hypothetical protein
MRGMTLFLYALQFVSDPSSFLEEDREINTVLTPEEQMDHDYNVRRDAFLKQPLSVWTAMYDLHGWTTRVQREWKSANPGVAEHKYPWHILTQESRHAWFREFLFPDTP